MLDFLIDYGFFSLGAVLNILGKIKEYKQMAEANPDPKIVYDFKHFIYKEWVNLAQLAIGGIALIVIMPFLTGGATVDLKSAEGQVITTLALHTILRPFYLLTGYSGTSGVLSVFGTYKKTLMNRVGVQGEK